jgi:hypothetical protein
MTPKSSKRRTSRLVPNPEQKREFVDALEMVHRRFGRAMKKLAGERVDSADHRTRLSGP